MSKLQVAKAERARAAAARYRESPAAKRAARADAEEARLRRRAENDYRWKHACPPRFTAARIEAIPGLTESLRSWVETPDGVLFLSGPTGTGKTHAGWATLRLALEMGKTVSGTTATEYIQAWRPDGDARLLREWESADFLLLDDLGSHLDTAFAAEKLTGLFDVRWRRGGATIITSNHAFKDIRPLVGQRSWSRLCDSPTVLRMAGNDMRLDKSAIPPPPDLEDEE